MLWRVVLPRCAADDMGPPKVDWFSDMLGALLPPDVVVTCVRGKGLWGGQNR